MTRVAIKAEGVSKLYRLGEDRAGTWARSVLGRLLGRDTARDQLWALNDVSFALEDGEVLGVVGHNGAGKSTLLKILAGITEPTRGRIEIRGRVGSLLEVGTGFHPDLTGMENIFLNGAILGMRRSEITRKLDAIIAFSEIERFLDTPVRRYSSGMRVRLAFSVAAHLEPEILVIDEVLAVGDAAFQKKCLGKMSDVSAQGRTVLFVSHNLAAINRLCTRALLLEDGRLVYEGPAQEVVAHYMKNSATGEGELRWERGTACPGVDDFAVYGIRLRNSRGEITSSIDVREAFHIEIDFQAQQALPYCRVGLILSTADGIDLFEAYDFDDERYQETLAAGAYTSDCEVTAELLKPGSYSLSVIAGIPNVRRLVRLFNVLSLTIEETSAGSSLTTIPRRGVLRPRLQWHRNRR